MCSSADLCHVLLLSHWKMCFALVMFYFVILKLQRQADVLRKKSTDQGRR